MAVPKQKQSHARSAKRRAQHKVKARASQACPRCGAPKLPHRVCGGCGHYAGRDAVEQ